MKRIYTAAVACLAVFFGQAAHAQTYIGISGGLDLPADSKNKGTFSATVPATAAFPAIPSTTPLAWRTKFDRGYDISAMIGKRLANGLRVEAQVNFTRSGVKRHSGLTAGGTNIDAVDVAVLTRGAPAATNPTVGTVINSGVGSQRSFGAFANAYYDFNSGGKLMPYVGAGVGAQRVRFDYRPSNVDVGQGKGTKFAWQAMAGATYKAGQNAELFAQYSYRDSGRTTVKLDLVPANLKAKSRHSIVSLGVRIPFGK